MEQLACGRFTRNGLVDDVTRGSIESVPNFSEGRDPARVEDIVAALRAEAGVKLLDYQIDGDHNRSVMTSVGDPEAVKEAVVEAIGVAVEVIDMTRHQGRLPRMGAVDVVPFIPIRNMTVEDAIGLSKAVASEVAEKYSCRSFFTNLLPPGPNGRTSPTSAKASSRGWPTRSSCPSGTLITGRPRYPTAGVAAVGARMPLVAYNVNLGTDRLDIADSIAKKVRHLSGGLEVLRTRLASSSKTGESCRSP